MRAALIGKSTEKKLLIHRLCKRVKTLHYISCSLCLAALQTPRNALQTPRNALQAPRNALQTPRNALQTPRNALQTPRNALQTPRNALQTPRRECFKKCVSKVVVIFFFEPFAKFRGKGSQ